MLHAPMELLVLLLVGGGIFYAATRNAKAPAPVLVQPPGIGPGDKGGGKDAPPPPPPALPSYLVLKDGVVHLDGSSKSADARTQFQAAFETYGAEPTSASMDEGTPSLTIVGSKASTAMSLVGAIEERLAPNTWVAVGQKELQEIVETPDDPATIRVKVFDKSAAQQIAGVGKGYVVIDAGSSY